MAKAQLDISDRLIKIIIIGILLPLLVFVFIAFAYTYKTPYVPAELDEIITSERFMNTCFSYQDKSTLRQYPGMLDLSKFTDEGMKACYELDKQKAVAYKLTLEWKDQKRTVQTANWRQRREDGVQTKRVVVSDGGLHGGTLRIAHQLP